MERRAFVAQTLGTTVKRLLLILLVLYAEKISAQDLPSQNLKTYFHTLKDWLRDTVRVREQMHSTDHVMDKIFDWDEITRRTFEDNWGNISKTWQKRLTDAIRFKIIRDGSEWMLRFHKQINEKNLRWSEEEVNEPRAKISLDILLNGEITRVNFRLQSNDESWKIYDIRTENFRLIKTYLNVFNMMLNEGYNNEYVETRIDQSDSLIIDDFNSNEAEDYPKSWGWRKKDDPIMSRSSKLYHIQEEDQNLYLSGKSQTQPVILVKPFSYNLKEFPVLTWQWRVKSLPKYSGKGADRMAAVTVIFYQNWIGVPITLSYVWSTVTAPCTILSQDDFFYTSYSIVLRSSEDKVGEWITEEVNPYEDYRRIFGEYPPEQTIGISVLNDPQSSGILSAVDYDNFVARTTADSLSCLR
ncbi:DUF3047 domain-containing protein [bacterium]|nr:DUF3047 domain-containing protein [bacterium]